MSFAWRHRGWTDLAINGSFWIGGALGAASSIFVLDPTRFDLDIGWRLTFFIGCALGLIILFLRTWIPESPRWLVIHGREQEAEKVVDEIGAGFRLHGVSFQDVSTLTPMRLHPRTHTPLREVFHTLFITFRVRTFLALALMMAQGNSEGVVANRYKHIFGPKSRLFYHAESKHRSHPAACGRQVSCGYLQIRRLFQRRSACGTDKSLPDSRQKP